MRFCMAWNAGTIRTMIRPTTVSITGMLTAISQESRRS